MADSLSTIGSIATFIVNTVTGMPAGVSGNMVQLVDLSRQYVAQFTGANIGSNNIPENYQSAVVNFAMANTVDMLLSQPGGAELSLGDLSIKESGQLLTSDQYRKLGEMQLKVLGRKTSFARSLS